MLVQPAVREAGLRCVAIARTRPKDEFEDDVQGRVGAKRLPAVDLELLRDACSFRCRQFTSTPASLRRHGGGKEALRTVGVRE